MIRPGEEHRFILWIAAGLLLAGLLLAFTAGPVAATRMGYDSPFHFAWRHAVFAVLACAAFALAMRAPPLAARRLGVVALLGCLALMALLPFLGNEVKGARRWLSLGGGISIQPSEIAKPAFVLTVAWMLSLRDSQPRFPGLAISIALFAVTAGLLLLQPDVGQTALLAATLATMLFAAGAPLWLFAAGAALGAVGAAGAYFSFDHVRQRVAIWLDPEREGYQTSKALDAIASGGAFGRGPGEGVVKNLLPDAHADFVFAAAVEEFGWLASLGLVAAYGLLLYAGLRGAARLSGFERHAASGLVFLIAIQAAIHMGVNLSLAPAKGMTLPLVSYGGTALVGSALALGLVVSLLRPRRAPAYSTARAQRPAGASMESAQ